MIRRIGAITAAALTAALAGGAAPATRLHAELTAGTTPFVTTTVPYGSAPAQTFDLNRDPSVAAAPWVMVVHGGSWVSGSKGSIAATAAKLNGEGFATVNVSYRLDATSPEGIRWITERDDVAAAWAYVLAHPAELGLDPARGSLYGYSSGGHLAVTAAVQEVVPGARAVVSVSAPLQPTRILDDVYAGRASGREVTLALNEAAVVGCGDRRTAACTQRWLAFSPHRSLDAADPPLWVVTGRADPLVPVGTATSFCRLAAAAGVPCQATLVPGGVHSESILTGDATRWASMVGWLRARTA